MEDGFACVAFPLPWGDSVAEELLEERTEGEFAVVAIGEQDHAVAGAREADEKVFCAAAVALLEEGRPEASVREETPAEAVGEPDMRAFAAGFGAEFLYLLLGKCFHLFGFMVQSKEVWD